MPSYYDEKTKTWYCKFNYTDWMGRRNQKLKRGFPRKKDAREWEANFIASYKYDTFTTFGKVAADYLEEIAPRRRCTTVRTYQNALDNHITPTFGSIPMGQITEKRIIDWQNSLLAGDLSEIYLHKIDTVFRTVYAFGARRCKIIDNPFNGIEKIGRSNVKTLHFWTLEEYRTFIAYIENPVVFAAYELLYYCGIRIGELFALTAADVDTENHLLHITKSLQRVKRQDVITPPKTAKGIRDIVMPDFLCKELENYMGMLYDCSGETRLFEISKQSLYYPMKKYTEMAGLTRIRVHDLRHSHVALLIEKGVSPLVIAERLGHENITVTLGTYGHLYPNKQKEIADILDNL